MKRMLTLLAAMMLLLTAFPASAESLFSLLPASQTEPIPNYGLMAGVDPVSVETLEDGSTSHRYINVQPQSFLDFGTLLGEKGYAIDPDSMKVEGSAQTMNLVKEDIVFTVCYDQVALTLVVTYPEGANVEVYEEPDPFEGYVEIVMKEVINVKTGSFSGTFSVSFYNSIMINFIYGKSGPNQPCMGIDVHNKGISSYPLDKLFSNIQLHYINEDNHYRYSMKLVRKNSEFYISRTRYAYSYSLGSVASLGSDSLYACSDSIPQLVQTATDGTLAITFTFIPTNTNYIVYIRRPAE